MKHQTRGPTQAQQGTTLLRITLIYLVLRLLGRVQMKSHDQMTFQVSPIFSEVHCGQHPLQ
jgi:hypothetical protein